MRYFFLFLVTHHFLFAVQDSFINPLTDICWECVFPITVSGVNITPGKKDFEKSKSKFCYCHGLPPKAGLPLSYWEPSFLMDVTKEAYKLLGLGGVSIGESTIKNRGVVSKTGRGANTSFSHVHLYEYPVLEILDVLTDFSCISKKNKEVSYFSELDYSWYDDSFANLLNPEVAFFSSPVAQVACVADCTASSANKPLDKLFWCAGCHGSLYPFSGTVGSHVGDIQASLLLMQRVLAKMHRTGFLKGYEKENFCNPSYMPIWKKSSYKTQMTYPVAKTKGKCPSLGGTEVIWGAGKSFPKKGEEFVYLIWTKKHCCLDAVKHTIPKAVP